MSDLKAVAYRNRIVAQLLLEPDEVKIQVPHDASQSRRMTFHNRPIRRLREVPNAVRTKRRNPSMAIMMVARRLPLRPISPHLAPFRMDRRCASFCLESFPKLDAALHDGECGESIFVPTGSFPPSLHLRSMLDHGPIACERATA
jgi:hypothetical protein